LRMCIACDLSHPGDSGLIEGAGCVQTTASRERAEDRTPERTR